MAYKMKFLILTLPILLTGCLTYPSVVCKDGKMYSKVGVTSIYTATEMSCIEVKNYFQTEKE